MRTSSTHRGRLALVALGAAAALAAGVTIPAAGANTWGVKVSPQRMHPQGLVTVQASGFAPGQGVVVSIAGQVVAHTTANSSGVVDKAVAVPASAQPGLDPVLVNPSRGGAGKVGRVRVRTNWTMDGHSASLSSVNPYENTLSAANVAQASLVWQSHETNPNFGDDLTGGLIVENGIGYDVSLNGLVHAYDLSSGQILWETNMQEPLADTPLVTNGYVWIGASCLFRLDAATGADNAPQDCSGPGGSSPVLDNNVVYSGGNGLYALDPNSEAQQWSALTGQNLEFFTPAIDNGTAFVDGYLNQNPATPEVYAVSLSTHQVLWHQTPTYRLDVPGVAGDGLYVVVAGNGAVYAYNQTTGALVWTAGPYSAGPNVGRPAIDANHVYVVTGDSTLRALSVTDGSVSWSIPNFGLTYGSFPTLANGVLYAGSNTSQLQAIDPNTGQVLANYASLIGPTGGACSTTIVNGNLYVLTKNRGLYDIALPGSP